MSRAAKLGALLATPAVWPALVRSRTAAALEHRAVLARIAPHTVIDVGANTGQFTLAARATGVVRVIAFEPLKAEADKFARNFGSDEAVTLHRVALGREEGTRTLHLADRRDSSSLLPLAAGQEAAFGVRPSGAAPVSVRRLDSCLRARDLQAPVMLKIDVQGAEHDVIAGAQALLPAIDAVYLEASFVPLYANQLLAGEVISRLEALGFSLRGIFNCVTTRAFGPTQADFLFLAREAG